MAPSKPSKPSSSVTYNIRSITKNWKIHRVHECLPRALWPNKQFEATQWDIGILTLLSQISAVPNATIQDFRAKARRAIKARQERNGTAAGKVGWVKVTDLKAVLKEYEKEIAEADAAKNAQEEADSIGNIQTEFVELPKTPMAPVEDSEEEDEEQGSSEPLPGGKYQYLTHVRPLKVDLNPSASPPKKAIQPKATRGKKRQVEEEAPLDPSAIERPSVVQQDPDPRAPDDTGFLSDLEPEKTKQKERKKKRLSRLEQYPVRVPHWQRNLDYIAAGPLRLSNGTEAANGAVSEGTLVNGKDEDEDLEMNLDNLPSIPINATVKERREMEELRLRMEQRIWRIKVLRIKEREGRSDDLVGQGEVVDDGVSQGEEGDAEDENDDSDERDEIENEENGTPGEGRVLRSRKAK
ncbi:hypothetical protein COCMIDRAFT_87193 [Bipolaris oryzae ATCC 44560]|uniref:Uncharacterized protein n=1 Tax=Bipolaris oryzae ATCC 44560 TaxID=930090 RepID=W6ZEX5_COCMI|nr:uncharacterized protein COCMIDRAFT_87193 [Bipolaris oryzae ATCC 44560]EUC48570.1 hypothetical protein COCMIDRAFT_87193 [Bipolaris oryzae ATCC 44560]